MKLIISMAVVLALMGTPVFANDLDLSLLQSIDEHRQTFLMAMQMGLVERADRDIEAAHYIALNVAYANEEEERYLEHAELLEEIYTWAEEEISAALGFTPPEPEKQGI